MNHAAPDDLLLLAYGELSDAEVARVEAHLRECASCRAQFTQLDTANAALDAAFPRTSRRLTRWTVGGGVLAAAALIAAILIVRRGTDEPRGVWPRQLEWSTNAGYFAGGRAVIVIDGQLRQLEQGWPYGRP